jgi:hypothetical protein
VKRGGFAWVLYFLIAIGLFADAAIGRGAFFHYDTWMQNYAFRAWWFDQLHQGHFATWCPGIFAGFPLFAETQTGPLYPPTFLLFLSMPSFLAFSWSVILHFALAGWGMHLLVGRLGASFWPCFLSGIAFALSGFMFTHVVHFNLLTGAALFPWAIYFAVGIAARAGKGERAHPRDLVGLAVAAACFFLGSHPYATFMCFLSALLLAALLSGNARALGRAGLTTLGAWLAGAAIGAVQLLPAMDFLGRTSRGGAVDRAFLTFGSFPPWSLAAAANPDVFGTPVDGSYFGGPDWSHFAETCAYVGLLPVALAAAAIVLRRDRVTFAFTTLAAASFLLMLGKYTVLYRAIEFIPLLQSTRLPARFILILTFAIAALAGLGFDALLKEGRPDVRRRAAAIGGAIILLLTAFAWIQGQQAIAPAESLRVTGREWPAKMHIVMERAGASRTRTITILAGSFALLAALSSRRFTSRGRILALAAPTMVLADLASWGSSFNPRVPPRYLENPPPFVEALPPSQPRPRIFRQGVDEIWERMSRIPRADLFTPAWRGREKSYETGAWTLPPNSQLLYGVDSGEGFTSLIPLQWLEWMGQTQAMGASPRPDLSEAQADLLSLDAVLSTGAGIEGAGWESRSLPGDVWISRNLDPLPRVRLASAWKVQPRREILEQIHSSDYNSRSGVLLEEDPPGATPSSAQKEMEAISAREEGPGNWVIEVPANAGGMVVLAESFDPGWKAWSPGDEPLRIQRSDGYFCAFPAPREGGQVRVRYQAPLLRAGAIVSLLSVLCVAMFAVRAGPAPRTSVDRFEAASAGSLMACGVALAVFIASLIANTGDWRKDFRESTLAAAAARSWTAEAYGAYAAKAWDEAASLLESAAKAAPGDASIRERIRLVERERAAARSDSNTRPGN